jgi:hypothetical protein
MTYVYVVVTGARETLPRGWNADELAIVDIYKDRSKAIARMNRINRKQPEPYETALVQVWKVK